MMDMYNRAPQVLENAKYILNVSSKQFSIERFNSYDTNWAVVNGCSSEPPLSCTNPKIVSVPQGVGEIWTGDQLGSAGDYINNTTGCYGGLML